jgi:acetoin utilization deacetylase AcuC-like enzyme
MVRYLQEKLGVKRIMIVDWDAHPSDGTSQIFYDDNTVLVVSFHEYDFEHGERGGIQEIGYGVGEGYNINVPLPLGVAEDCYLDVFVNFVEPLAKSFNPDLIVVSAGFDAHFADPVGNLNLRSRTFFRLSGEILRIAKRVCGSRIVFVLEGGYNLLALPLSVSAVLYSLTGVEVEFYDDIGVFKTPSKKKRKINETVNELKKILSKYWKNF